MLVVRPLNLGGITPGRNLEYPFYVLTSVSSLSFSFYSVKLSSTSLVSLPHMPPLLGKKNKPTRKDNWSFKQVVFVATVFSVVKVAAIVLAA